MGLFGRKKPRDAGRFRAPESHTSDKSEKPYIPMNGADLPKSTIKRATRSRKLTSLIQSFFLFISLIFLILVEIGNTHIKPVLTDVYFLRLDLANIVPTSIPNAGLLNTIAQTIGLHDYYQFGLWNFCEGYVNQGITACSQPQTLYWFNPVEILLNELLAGATIALPTQATTYLDILKTASQVMFGLFLAGTCLTFVLIFLLPTNVYSRWVSFLHVILTFLSTLMVCVASAIATAIVVIFRNALTEFNDLNISANIGLKMFVFMWIASGFQLVVFVMQLSLCCCCASRRDVRKGKKMGNEKAYALRVSKRGSRR